MSCFLIAVAAGALVNFLMMRKVRRQYRSDMDDAGIEAPIFETSEITAWDRWWSNGVGGSLPGKARDGNFGKSLIAGLASIATAGIVFFICEDFS